LLYLDKGLYSFFAQGPYGCWSPKFLIPSSIVKAVPHFAHFTFVSFEAYRAQPRVKAAINTTARTKLISFFTPLHLLSFKDLASVPSSCVIRGAMRIRADPRVSPYNRCLKRRANPTENKLHILYCPPGEIASPGVVCSPRFTMVTGASLRSHSLPHASGFDFILLGAEGKPRK
jgi:hypothetical protein